VRKAFKFRLYPNKYQAGRLAFTLDLHRRIYNDALGWRKASWERNHKGVSYGTQSAALKGLRASSSLFKDLNFSSCQGTLRRLDRSYQNFFRRVKAGEKPGYPRFKADSQFSSVEFPSYGDGIKLVDGKLRIQAVGLIKVKMHREIEGKINTVQIKREAGKWYAVFSCDLGDVAVTPSQNKPVGVDVGLEYFLTTSDGDHVKNPRVQKKELTKLRRQQRSVSRKKLGGRNRRKAVKDETKKKLSNLLGDILGNSNQS
jgi:putative transposase